jgi:hypothetical protein
MPRSRALRSTLEMPPRFSTATAITSTFRVIQFSTSSFCLAASRLVGPSQISSTPVSDAASSAPARQLTKYGSPLALGIMATTGRRAAGAAALLPGARVAGASECTSHALVPATMSEPATIVAHRTATWLFFTSSSAYSAETTRLRVCSRSIAMVATSSIPVSTPASSEGSAARWRPSRSTDSEKRPSSVPPSVPRPPNTDVPPRTTAVMASSS